MALLKTDWSHELGQARQALDALVDDKVQPMIKQSIADAGDRLGQVVQEASGELQLNIRKLSDEIHNHRSLTRDEIVSLIDYAAEKIGQTVDQRLVKAREEVSGLLAEKIEQVKSELEDAAVRSRRTLFLNLALSVGAAVLVATVGLIYKKLSLGELDVFALFRVLLLAGGAGTGLFAALKAWSHWRGLNRHKRHAATVAIQSMGLMRPDGAWPLLILAVVLLLLWAALSLNWPMALPWLN